MIKYFSLQGIIECIAFHFCFLFTVSLFLHFLLFLIMADSQILGFLSYLHQNLIFLNQISAYQKKFHFQIDFIYSNLNFKKTDCLALFRLLKNFNFQLKFPFLQISHLLLRLLFPHHSFFIIIQIQKIFQNQTRFCFVFQHSKNYSKNFEL